jgi:hypothetical protein
MSETVFAGHCSSVSLAVNALMASINGAASLAIVASDVLFVKVGYSSFHLVVAALTGATADKYAAAALAFEMVVVVVGGTVVELVALDLLGPLDPHAATKAPAVTTAHIAPRNRAIAAPFCCTVYTSEKRVYLVVVGTRLDTPATKRCPWCAEEILVDAKKCKHCGEYLTDDSAAPLQKESEGAPPGPLDLARRLASGEIPASTTPPPVAPSSPRGRQKLSDAGTKTDGGLACPKCGGNQFTAKRSKKGKAIGFVLAAPLAFAAPKSQVKCVTCGTMFKRG